MVDGKRILGTLLILTATGTMVWAGELIEMKGDEPLRSQINAAKDSVRLLFLGSPT